MTAINHTLTAAVVCTVFRFALSGRRWPCLRIWPSSETAASLFKFPFWSDEPGATAEKYEGSTR